MKLSKKHTFLHLLIFCVIVIFGDQEVNDEFIRPKWPMEIIRKSPIQEPTNIVNSTNPKNETRFASCANNIYNENQCYVVQRTLTSTRQDKLLFVNLVDRSRRTALMSATFVDSSNFGKSYPRTDAWQPHNSIAENEQPYCKHSYPNAESWKRDDFLGTRYRQRGHLTPVYGNQYSPQAIADTFYCVNTAPQDAYMNMQVWKYAEKLALNIIRFSGEAYIVTGTCRGVLDIPREFVPGAPPGWVPLDVSECFWKFVCIKPTLASNGRARVGGWIGYNYVEAIGSKPTQPFCAYLYANTIRPRSADAVLQIADYTVDELRQMLSHVDAELPIGSRFSEQCFGNTQELIELNGDLSCSLQVDLTLAAMEVGEAVVRTVVNLIIKQLSIPRDYEFIFRAALTLSNFGEKLGTFSNEFFGGIWLITAEMLAKTKSADPALLAEIINKFDIDWLTVVHKDMLKPLYSGLAAAISYDMNQKKPSSVKPFTITAAIGLLPLIFVFAKDSNNMEEELRKYYRDNPSRGSYDLVVLLDGSGSIGNIDFITAKAAVANLLSSTKRESENTRVGLIVFSTTSTVVFDLNNNYTPDQLTQVVNQIPYPDGNTNTHEAILDAITMIKESGETTTPYVCIVLTDGQSTKPSATVAAAKQAIDAGILTFAVGIGAAIDTRELITIAGGEDGHVFHTDTYEDLLEMPLWLNVQFDAIPTRPSLEYPINDTVALGESRFYQYDLPSDGITIEVVTTEGSTAKFYSYSYENPSEVYHDGEIEIGLHHIIISTDTKTAVKSSTVFVSVIGLEAVNSFSIFAYQGLREGCGFKGIDIDVISSEPVSVDTPEGFVIWSAESYGYETNKHGVQNSLYVNQVVTNGLFEIVTKPRFGEYIKETGLSTMNVTVSFSCPESVIKEYTIVVPIIN